MSDARARTGRWIALALALGMGAVVGAAAPVAAGVPSPVPAGPISGPVASTSVTPMEQSQEALLRELAQPPLPPEIFSELMPYSLPVPIIGGLGVEVE